MIQRHSMYFLHLLNVIETQQLYFRKAEGLPQRALVVSLEYWTRVQDTP